MSQFDYHKYRRTPQVTGFKRTWPEKELTQAPIWVSEDLRDGNQALLEPMTVAQKEKLWRLLVKVGFKEIMVGFPSASKPDYDFVRWLIDEQQIPDDVTIAVLTQAREHLIDRTFESLEGIHGSVIIHLYNSTSTIQRERVFGLDQQGIIDLAVAGTRRIKENAARRPGVHWRLEYSPESFSTTEMDFAVRICEAVADVWQPTPQDKIIFNLPDTVQLAGPNHHADQIEYFCQHIKNRASVIVSLHTHNDRGCGVAAAELALLAGAERVEGTLLGNGERTGNTDLLVMAMNLYSDGIDPKLDLSDPDEIVAVGEECTRIPLHPRHPWVGDLVYTAFSGSHQDAIRKSLRRQKDDEPWQVAYLPIDPRDIGRDYQAVIRVNSQSGKGGMTFLLERDFGISPPRWMMLALAPFVQEASEKTPGELSSTQIRDILFQHFSSSAPLTLLDQRTVSVDGSQKLSATVRIDGKKVVLEGRGDDVAAAFATAWRAWSGEDVAISDHKENHLADGSTVAFVQWRLNTLRIPAVAQDTDAVRAILLAAVAAINLSRAASDSDQYGGLAALVG